MDADWLKTQFRLHPERTKAALARALNLDPPAISKIINGGRQIKAQEYISMRQFFGLPVDGEKAARGGIHPSGDSESYVLSPMSQHMSENDHGDTKNEDWVMPASLLAGRTKAPPEKIKIFTVQENAMAPDYMPGEVVLVDLSDKNPSPSGVFIISDGMSYLIRQGEYVPLSQPPQIKFSAANPKFEAFTVDLEKAEIKGRIIAKLEWV